MKKNEILFLAGIGIIAVMAMVILILLGIPSYIVSTIVTTLSLFVIINRKKIK